jgi:hypothetical protein
MGVVGLKSHAQPPAVEKIFSGRQVTCLADTSPLNRDKITPEAIQLVSTQVVAGDLCSATISKRFVVSGTIGERFVVSGTIGERFVVSGAIGERFVVSGAIGERFVVSGTIGERFVVSGTIGKRLIISGAFCRGIGVADGFLVSFRLKVPPGAVFYRTVTLKNPEIAVSPVWAKRDFHRAHRRTFTRPEQEDEGFPPVNLVVFVFGFFASSEYFNSREVTAETLQAFHLTRPDQAKGPGEGNQAGQEQGNDKCMTSPQARRRTPWMPFQVFPPF